MPQPIEARQAYYQGEDVRILGTVADGAGDLLTSEGAGDLTVTIFERPTLRQVATLFYDVSSGDPNGVVTPTKAAPWSKPGFYNFDHTLTASVLAGLSPPFRFRGGRSYLVRYEFSSPTEGKLILHYYLRILASPG